MKQILTLNFDGVIHSYTTKWERASVIPDAPVDGAIEFILKAKTVFDVKIHSSRSHQWGGRRAMKQWLKKHLKEWYVFEYYRDNFDYIDFHDLTEFDLRYEPWDLEVEYWANSVIQDIGWPIFKSPSFITIDDRAVTFTGEWPDLNELIKFKSWNKK